MAIGADTSAYFCYQRRGRSMRRWGRAMVGAQYNLCRALVMWAAASVWTASSAVAATDAVSGSGVRLARTIDSIAQSGRRQLDLPGVSLVIMKGDNILLAKGYGWADLHKKIPATAATVYPVGFLSKQFTAAAVMTLVNRHEVSLDEPVTTYLPEYRSLNSPPPTVRQLLQQTSGIPTWDDLPELQDESDVSKFTLPKVIDVLSSHSPAYRAGDWWSYSNSNYTLLARLIERVTGMPYDQYLNRSLFAPLCLRATSECESRPADAPVLAAGYNNVGGNFLSRPMSPADAIAMAGAGGLCSNALDLAMWAHSLVDGRAVGLAAFRQMTIPTTVRAGFTAPYGFGISLLPFAGQKAVWHTGVMAGYISVLVYFPERDITIAALTNSRHVWLHSVAKKVARAVMELKVAPILDLPIPEQEIDRSIGKYDDYLFKFRVYRHGADLFASVDALGKPLRLRYQGGHGYSTSEPEGLRFHFGPEVGAVNRVDWEWTELRAFARPVRN